jgi:hypothetical protein
VAASGGVLKQITQILTVVLKDCHAMMVLDGFACGGDAALLLADDPLTAGNNANCAIAIRCVGNT